MKTIQQAAKNLLSHGYSVIPVNDYNHPENPKAPIISWKPYQDNRMRIDEISKVFRNNYSLAIVGGKVSENLECLDFDKPGLFEPFRSALKEINPKLDSKLITVRTPSGGYHIVYRCSSKVSGNNRLAVSSDGNKTWIETRGEGGYFLTVPSPGYELLENSFQKIAIISEQEREQLFSLAKSFSDRVEPEEVSREIQVNGNRPGDDYNRCHSDAIPSILESYGWLNTGRIGTGGQQYWTRPGKSNGTSATLRDGCFYVFSTNANLPVGSHSAFSIYTHLEHKGDFRVAAKALVLKGYGDNILMEIEKLAKLPAIQYDQLRKEKAEELGIRVSTLDREVADLLQEDGSDNIFEVISPWPEPVSIKELLDEIRDVINIHLVLPKHTDIACALWVVLSYCFGSFRILPLLGISSPEKRCGKTTLSEVLQGLVYKPVMASNLTAAVLYRLVEKHKPTLIVDEADTFLVNNDELRGVFNAGHTRKSAYVWRCNPDTNDPEKFSVWGPKVVLMIGNLPETMKDRSILIHMKRKTSSEKVEKLTLDFDEHHLHIRRKLMKWCRENAEILSKSEPLIPDVQNDRATDNWFPLFAIAKQAGEEWVVLARSAMLVIEGNKMVNDRNSIGQMLLADIKRIYEQKKVERISSTELVDALNRMGDRIWGEYYRGNPITQNALSRLLKPYGISSKKIRFEDKPLMGYEAKSFEDAFTRYLSSEDCCQSGTTEHCNEIRGLDVNYGGTSIDSVPFEKHDNLLESQRCSAVPDIEHDKLQKGNNWDGRDAYSDLI